MRIKKTNKRADLKDGATYDSLKSAASGMKLPLSLLKKAKGEGCSAFRGGRVNAADLRSWLKENPIDATAGGDLREQKLAQEIRRLSIANDSKERALVGRAWVLERFQRAGGELHTLRAKSEAEHPLLFAASCPGADVSACRTILRGIWSEVFGLIEGIGRHFEESQTGAASKPRVDAAVLSDGAKRKN